jgi:predicted  nucleic acid-binding Zn-ribbon protein
MDLKVIEPIEKPLKTFSGIDEFNLYYMKNKEEIEKQTTHMLNRRFHIDGYHITKIKGVLSLKKWDETKKYYKSKKDVDNSEKVESSEITSEIETMNEKINLLTQKVESQGDEITKINQSLIEIKQRINAIIEIIDEN